MITRDTIEDAHNRILPYVHRTPVLTSASINAIAGSSLYFKAENLQKGGAFKARGAMNATLLLTADQRAKGVATHSSGNHAQALARAASILNIPAHIVMPRTVPVIKKRGVEAFGGNIFECEPGLQAREAMLDDVIRKTGATPIHPFNNENVIAGQATAAKELFEANPGLDIIVAPVGGGGLLAGTGLAAKYFSPQTVVVGAEPEGADDAYRSLKSGSIEPSQANSIADGLLATLGDKPFSIIRDTVDHIVTVSDQEIVAAMRLFWERLKTVVEPSGAVALAAVLKSRERFAGRQIGIIISGGNVNAPFSLPSSEPVKP